MVILGCINMCGCWEERVMHKLFSLVFSTPGSSNWVLKAILDIFINIIELIK